MLPHDLYPNYFKTSRGYLLHLSRYPVPNPRGIVFLVHGFGEHQNKYAGLSYKFNQLGLTCVSVDLVGHGASQGDRNYIPQFADHPSDVIEFINNEYNMMENRFGPYSVDAFGIKGPQQFPYPFVLGHSMGGLICSHVGIRWTLNKEHFTPYIKGLRFILSAPGLALDPKLTNVPMLLAMAEHLSGWLPRLVVQNLPSNKMSHTRAVIEFCTRDPMCNPPIVVARFGLEFIKAIKYAHDNAKHFKSPVLIAHSPDDLITNISGSKLFLSEISTPQGDAALYECKGYHEILSDMDRENVVQQITQFITKHLENDKIVE